MMAFAILFGLSMDYEVFLLSRDRLLPDIHIDAASEPSSPTSATSERHPVAG